jgi:CheY-like chemotaxis protein
MPKTILVVEDSDDDVFLLSRAFKSADLISPLLRAANGQEAIDYLSGKGDYADRAKFPFPSLVLLDIKMPFISGFEVLSWVRQQTGFGALPIVVFTTSDQECDVKRAYAAGANAYLVKPAQLEACEHLARLIKQFWIDANVGPTVDFSGVSLAHPVAAVS